jgi:hypothetical protein
MTAAERQELSKVVRFNAKVAKADVEAHGKQLLADAEAKLAAIYEAEDAAWADITATVRRHVAEADAAIAALAAERGIPKKFRPSIGWYFLGRGENSDKDRRAELRKVAQTEVAARVKRAQVEIDRWAAQQLTKIAQAGLTTEEARAFLKAMPTPKELLPPLDALELAGGERVQLEARVPAPPAGAGTPSRNGCP